MQKKMIITMLAVLIMISSSLIAGTNRWVSDGTGLIIKPDGSGVPDVIVTDIPGEWGGYMVTPKANSKIAEDGALWLGVNTDGLHAGYGQYIYNRDLGNIIPYGNYHSRMTFWGCADDSIRFVAISQAAGPYQCFFPDRNFSHMDRLVRIDLTDATINAGQNYHLHVFVKNSSCCYTGLTYYLSVDYSDDTEDFYQEWEAGTALHALPFKPYHPYNQLNYIYPDAVAAWCYDQKTASYNSLTLTAPLTGDLGDKVRSHSIWVQHSSSGSSIVKGYPIFEQRFHDIRINDPGMSSYRTPGTVYCIVPFNCAMNQPDDRPNLAINEAWRYNQSISNYTGITSLNTCFSSPLGKGYMIRYGSNQNTHLDIRCSPALMTYSRGESVLTVEDIPEFVWEEIENSYNTSGEEIAQDSLIEVITPQRETPNSINNESLPEPPFIILKEAKNQLLYQFVSVQTNPNPFNSAVDITVEGYDGRDGITVSIYDLTGNLITTLDNAGNGNLFRWNGLNAKGKACPSGAYLYHVDYDNETVAGKILYLK